LSPRSEDVCKVLFLAGRLSNKGIAEEYASWWLEFYCWQKSISILDAGIDG